MACKSIWIYGFLHDNAEIQQFMPFYYTLTRDKPVFFRLNSQPQVGHPARKIVIPSLRCEGVFGNIKRKRPVFSTCSRRLSDEPPKKYRIMNSQKGFSGSSGSFLFTGCRGLWKKQETKMSAFPTAVSSKKIQDRIGCFPGPLLPLVTQEKRS